MTPEGCLLLQNPLCSGVSPLQQVFFQLIPVLFVLVLAFNRSVQRRMNNVRRPVRDKLLRPPGESLRLKIEQMDERTNVLLAGMVMISAGASSTRTENGLLDSNADGRNTNRANTGLHGLGYER